MLKFSAWLAILTGVILAAGVTAINLRLPDTVLYDVLKALYFTIMIYIAALMLVAGGIVTLRESQYGGRLLAGSWAVAFFIVYSVASPQLEYLISSGSDRDDLILPMFNSFVWISAISILIAFIACIGFFTAIIGKRHVR